MWCGHAVHEHIRAIRGLEREGRWRAALPPATASASSRGVRPTVGPYSAAGGHLRAGRSSGKCCCAVQGRVLERFGGVGVALRFMSRALARRHDCVVARPTKARGVARAVEPVDRHTLAPIAISGPARFETRASAMPPPAAMPTATNRVKAARSTLTLLPHSFSPSLIPHPITPHAASPIPPRPRALRTTRLCVHVRDAEAPPRSRCASGSR